MRIFDKQNRNLVALTMVFLLIILVYGATSALTLTEAVPEECNETFFSLTNVCINSEKTAYNGFMNALELKIENSGQAVNGFRIRVYGTKGMEPVVVFKTIHPHVTGLVTAPFKDEVIGQITRIEVEPLLNINQEITYCSLSQGNVYEGNIGEC